MTPASDSLYVWFIDVGMGDATFVKFPDGTTMLIDFGSTKAEQIKGDILNFFQVLKDNKFITSVPFDIDYLFITHPDQDHYNLLQFLIKAGYSFKNIFFTGQHDDYKAKGKIEDKKGNKWNSFKDWLKDQENHRKAFQLNQPNGQKSWQKHGDAEVHLLAANVANQGKHTTLANNRSIVLMIEYKGQKILLAADATYITEKKILDNINSANGNLKGLDISNAILKLGHHGSARTSTSKEWVETVKPICLFISSERTGTQYGQGGNASGHRLPQQAAIDTVKQFAPNSLKKTTDCLPIRGEFHSYVAYHDDVDKPTNCFGKSRSVSKFCEADQIDTLEEKTILREDISEVSNYYYEKRTDNQIFTTICKLDYPIKRGTGQPKRPKIIADRGTTYGLEIKSNSKYMIYPWLGEEFEDFDHWTEDDTYYHLGEE
ncbi:ComEC/Rec2 family competence protein [Okeania sp. SIO2B9]|uniref:ComEC/Rec2 family competence protein n=1 Tax=Okeania sp. SIO2B9 TaxID=2607782 RepID=UPI00142ACACC|nr:MBL fold metallo-hydrolase [Okeania sp. SIO2B9]NES88938.1 MBL fold metallo-hydrolase [Okeania sp. SIO2B9]